MKAPLSLIALCKNYLAEEPNEVLRNELQNLCDSSAQKDVHDRMSKYLSFGTAGLRGRMEAGYNRMNSVSVYRFAYALGSLLKAQPSSRVVIGFDCRSQSETFAQEIAHILSIMDVNVLIFDQVVPTPICAFAVKNLQADAGVMVTASHNPKDDNGIKLYDQTGAQALGEVLLQIEILMSQAPLRHEFFTDVSQKARRDQKIIGAELFAQYFNAIKTTKLLQDADIDRDVDIVYTPLHGVGKKFFLAACNKEGFNGIKVVPEQAEPDGLFPTVIFPNPEEEQTLDLAHSFAEKNHCDVVFANDPDADRLQVSCEENGQFRKLTGNEMGAILGYFCIQKALHDGVKPILGSSIVSSRMLKAMCERMQAHYVDALTGFSNIIAAAKKAEEQTGYRFVFGYEEALGFLVGQELLDKDGINASVRFLEILGFLKKTQRTIWQFLDELYVKFGVFVSEQWSIRFDGIDAMEKMDHVMAIARSLSLEKIASQLDVSECKKYDLLEDYEVYGVPRADVLIFEINQQVRLVIRPSGTEPKIKFYLEIFEKIPDAAMLEVTMARLRKAVFDHRIMISDMLYP